MHKIMSQARIDSLRIMLGLQLLLIHADKLFAFPRIFTKTIVSDAIDPGGKPRFTAKAPNILVRAEKSFLREIIRQGDICARKLSKEATHTGLMPSHKLAERMLIVIDKNSCDKVRIS
jgi:hypothetical protein